MIQRMNKIAKLYPRMFLSGSRKFANRGQTALILILLTAAALIFLAITMNWGRIAQAKSLLTIAADQSASTLASDAASYGEMEKQTYLEDINYQWHLNGVLLDIGLIIVAMIVTICTWGTAAPYMSVFVTEVLSVAAITMSVLTLALQLAVVNPMITSLWNKMEQNWPIQQQFYEGGLSTALQGVITDQVNITDYFDRECQRRFWKRE